MPGFAGIPARDGRGWIGKQTYVKAHGLSARGHEVHVVSASWDHEPRTKQDGAATIHRIGEPRLKLPGYDLTTY